MDCVYLYDKYGSPIGHDAWLNVVRLIDWVCEHWRERDESIWEVRGGRQEFLFSRVMCWVAIDRAAGDGKRSFPTPFRRWYDVRDTIYRDIFERFWDQARGGVRPVPERVDVRRRGAAHAARALRVADRSTLAVHARRHRARARDDSLVYRYRLDGNFSDGLTGQEGTFSMCSFCASSALSRMGDLQKARFFFERCSATRTTWAMRRGLGAALSISATSLRASPIWR